MVDESRNLHFRERFNTCISTWQAQVVSYWQRTSYFAVFEVAALAATWTVLSSGHWITATGGSLAGLYLTRVWYLSNTRMWEYVLYWWKMAGEIEKEWGLDSTSQLVYDYSSRRTPKTIPGEYSEWVQRVPKLFFVLWAFLFCLSFALLLSHHKSCSILHALDSFGRR